MNLPVAHLAGIFAPLELVPMLIAAALYARRATTLAARCLNTPVAELGFLDRFRAWLVTGAPGRGFAFTLNFAVAARTMWKARRRQQPAARQ